MLEEALRDPSKHPGEVAQAMLSFVRSDLPNGGASAEERFINLVSLLCLRTFGEMQEAKEFRHEPGGWLSAQNRWRTPFNSTPTQPLKTYERGRAVAINCSALSMDDDPVVQLLGPVPNTTASSTRNGTRNKQGHLRCLIDTISSEVESRPGVLYHFPFLALPEALQRQFLLVLKAVVARNTQPNPQLDIGIGNIAMGFTIAHSPQHPISLSPNSQILFNSLRVRPESQEQVRQFQQKQLQGRNQAQPLQLNPGLASPRTMSPVSKKTADQKTNTPNLFLSMFEHYMFLFIRYPLGAPVIPRQPQSQATMGPHQVTGRHHRQQDTPYGERIYFTLFSRYLQHFLPRRKASIHPHTGFSPSEKNESEFFLRVVIAFWLECHGSILTTANAVHCITERFQRTGVAHAPLADLNMSYDLTFGKFDPPPTIVQSCLRRLVLHIISDPTISMSLMNQGSQRWCLSPAMTVLQRPFYNYVRSAFRYASIHSQASVFYTALNAWLIWLEPWNVNHGYRVQNAKNLIISTVSGATALSSPSPAVMIPAADRKSTYVKAWEPYLAANVLLYTVPLAIFLRRARELDFSRKEMSRSMTVIKRVFRVFTPEIINSLEAITESLKCSEFAGFRGVLRQMAEYQRTTLLGDYAPSLSGNLSLSCCQADMQGLLEEIQLQHLKRVGDLGVLEKFAAFLEGLFGQGVVSGEEMAIQSLVERAKSIVGLPIDYEIFCHDPSMIASENRIVGAEVSSTAVRTVHGVLTDEGRRRLVTGRYKCNPADITFIGDPLKGRLKSYESAFLVWLTAALSTWLNKKLNLWPGYSDDDGPATEELFHRNLRDQKNLCKGFLINLRWFADYRNLMFLLLCGVFFIAWKQSWTVISS